MRKMSERSKAAPPTVPHFVKSEGQTEKKQARKNGSFDLLNGLNLPFSDMIKNDGDISLILGLALILLSEKSDKKLLFALLYILL